MAGPPKTTGRKENVRVQLGSALERMTAGKPFTETVHRMAELFEQALAENWGPPPGQAPYVEPDRRARLEAGIAQVKRVFAERDPDPELAELLRDEAAHRAAPQRQFLIGHDERSQRIVTQEELMTLAAEQFPSGLVPVGIDEEADELPREVDTKALVAGRGGDRVDARAAYLIGDADYPGDEVETTLADATETVADEDYSYLA